MLLAALIALCVAAMAGVSAFKRPAEAVLHPVRRLPADFEDAAKIDINAASVRELDGLPGVGEALAQRIVEYRAANGAFRSIEDIMLVDGIGEAIFDDMREMITAGE